jgi:hypothetical protein
MKFKTKKKTKKKFNKKLFYLLIALVFLCTACIIYNSIGSEKETSFFKSLNTLTHSTENYFKLPVFADNPNLKEFNVSLDNGLKISYKGHSVTYIPYFVMNDGTIYQWNQIPTSIKKNLWKEEISRTEYKYGVDFSNVSNNIRNNLRYVILHRSNATKTVNGIEVPMIAQDIEGKIVLNGNTVVINNEVYISHDDILRTYNIPIINRSDILISGLNNSWLICNEVNENGTCINETTGANWINNGDGTWNISFDPSITITESQAVIQALLTNVTAETGASNFTHLNISDTAPYNSLVGYWSFDGDKEQTLLTKAYDFSGGGNDGTYAGQANATASNCPAGFGKCAGFDGVVGSEISLGGINLVSGLDDMTVMAWIKLTSAKASVSNSEGYVSQSDATPKVFEIMRGTDETYRFKVWNDSASTAQIDVTKATLNTNWHHVVGVKNSTGLFIYYNGILNASNTTWNYPLEASSSAAAKIGRGDIANVNGTMDEVMIFNTSLTAQQISDIYNNQSARFAGTGLQELNNQTYLNISSGNNKVNLSVIFENNFESNVSAFLQYYESGAWSATSPQNLTNGTNVTFTIGASSTNLTLNLTLIAGKNQTKTFYTPRVYDDIILDYYSEGGADTTPPYFTNIENQTIAFPNKVYYDINASDETGFSCFTVNDTTNFKINCTGYLENNTALVAQLYNINISINDTSNNWNSSLMWVNITPDTTYPTINVTNPTNNTNLSSVNFYLNYTYVETNPSFCWYTNNSGIINSSTTAMGTNFTLKGQEGYNNLTLWCNDTSNNTNYSLISFRIDTTYPTINITNPTNNTNLSTANFYLNYTFVETYPDFCWYSNNSGITNSSPTAMPNNFTLIGMEGYNNLTLWCNDTVNNQNYSKNSFIIDTQPPYFTDYANVTIAENAALDYDINATDDYTEVDCFTINDTTNFNMSCIGIINNVTTLTAGEYKVNLTVNDSLNNINSTLFLINVTAVDSTFPNMTIIYPVNNSNLSSVTFDLNYTYTEINPGFCWYSNNSGIINSSAETMGTNWTSLTGLENNNNLTLWCNDTTNNVNYTEVSFIIDTIYPNINITYPANLTNSTDYDLNVNYTRNDTHIDVCWWTDDYGATNISNPTCNNLTGAWVAGMNNVTVYVNDTANNVNSSSISFTIDPTNPDVKITSPAANNTNSSDIGLDIEYIRSDYWTGVDTCWFSNDSYDTNTTLINCGNITAVTWTEDSHNVTIWVNDSVNHVNKSLISFTIDTSPPYFTDIANQTIAEGTALDYDINASDLYTEVDCFTVNSTLQFNISCTGILNNITTLAADIYWINITVNDSLNNLNSSIMFVNVTSTADAINPNVTFNFQDPSDLTTINGISYGVNVSYNISDETSLNASEVHFWKKINSSESDNSGIIINGTEEQNGFFNNYTYNTNVSNVWYFWMDDNDFYPGTYNINATLMDNQAHSIYSLSGVNSHIKVRLFNVSAYKNYSLFEIMANSSGTKSLRFYYCNSSYANGNNPVGDTSCSNFYNLAPTTTFNHTHSSKSLHQVIPFAINSSGYIGNVFVTGTSYFLARGQSGVGDRWNVYYISDVTRTNTIQNTTNSGTTWANISGTVDAHLHQYNGTESLWYYVCANDSSQNENCSAVRQDLLDKGGLPPSAPNVYSPAQGFYSGNININYTPALSPNGYGIEYNITLVNTTEDFNLTIHNNSINLSYVWDSTTASDGEYLIRVSAIDSNGLVSYGFSENITIDNTKPLINITEPFNNSDSYDTTLDINYTRSDTNLDSCWYSNDTYATNTTLTGCVNVTTVTWTVGNHNVTIWINDSANNINSSFVNFSISFLDLFNPNVTINTPTNSTYNSTTIIFNATALDETSITDGGCWVSIDDGATNLTLLNTTALSDYNATNTTVPDGDYHTQFWCNDSANNINNTETIDFTVDTKYSKLVITAPTNNSNLSSATFDFNYTFEEVNPGFCWYSNNTGITNSSYVTMGTNWTSLTGAEGINNRTLYCNDTANHNSTSIISFTIDTTYPDINITYPANNTNTTDNTIDVNYTTNEATTDISSCWYSNDSYVANTSLTSCANITTITWTEGHHNVTVWTNDSANNINSSFIAFTIDTTPPYFTAIANQTLADNVALNYDINAEDEFTEVDCFTVNDTVRFNISCTGVLNNFTALTVGIYWINITVNDSLNNLNFSIMFVNVTTSDNIPPYFITLANYTTPANTTFTTTIVAGDNVALSTYTLNDTTRFAINRTNGTITNATQLNNITSYWLNISINDTHNNLNSSVFYINVTATTGGGVTTVATPECRYKKLGYYNIRRVWLKQTNCI